MERKINMASFLMPYNSACIKGIAALCIMLGHYLSSFPWYIGGWLHGYLWVGIFFFYSGYGLRRSVETKENYLENFGSITKLMGFRIPHIINSAHINEF